MNLKTIGCCVGLAVATLAHAQTRIVCINSATDGIEIASIWPSPYISEKGALCFDVEGWPQYSGQNCVVNGGHISWTGVVIVAMDGESQGRDMTKFRIDRPVVAKDRIEYVIEWSRNGDWLPMQNVKINRLSGEAVSWFITMHGGDSYQCHSERRKF
jgi:hypothetical protein